MFACAYTLYKLEQLRYQQQLTNSPGRDAISLIIFLNVLYNYIGYPKAIWNHSSNKYGAPQISVHCISAIII